MFVKRPEETSNDGVVWNQARGMKASGRLINSTLRQPLSTCCRSFEASIRKKKGPAATTTKKKKRRAKFSNNKGRFWGGGEGGVTFGVDVIRTFPRARPPKVLSARGAPHLASAAAVLPGPHFTGWSDTVRGANAALGLTVATGGALFCSYEDRVKAHFLKL